MRKLYQCSSVMSLMIAFLFLAFGSHESNAQTITIGTGTFTSATSAGPTYISGATSTFRYSKHMSIYTEAEINALGVTAGYINELRWFKTDVNGYTLGDATFNIYLKEIPTSQTEFLTSPLTWSTEISGATLIFSSTSTSLPASIGWTPFTMSTPYLWNGGTNLQIMVEWFRPGQPTGAVPWQYTTTFNANALQGSSSNNTSANRNSNRPNLQIEFLPPAPPPCAQNHFPPDGLTSVCPSKPLFAWQPAPGSFVDDYIIYLGTDGGGVTTPTNVLNGVSIGNVTSFTYQGALLDNTTYYWEVRPSNISGPAPTCGIRTFDTGVGMTFGTITTTADSLCSGVSAVLSTTSYSGNMQWQENTGGGFTNIGAQNQDTITISPTTQTTYQAVYSDTASDCFVVVSNQIEVFTYQPTFLGFASILRDTICAGANAYLSISGNVGSIQWEEFDGSSWVPSTTWPGNDSNLFIPQPLTNTMYRAVVQNGSCADTVSQVFNVVTLNSTDPTGFDTLRCGPGTAPLYATGVGTLNWYEEPSGGGPVGGGSKFEPFVGSTQTFYVQSLIGEDYNIGPKTNTIGFNSNASLINWGIGFDVHQPCNLDLVHVYPGSFTGLITINMRQMQNGPILFTVTDSVKAFAGKTAIGLDFPLLPGTGYRLELAAGSQQLSRNTSGASYPYTVANGPLTITGYLNPTLQTTFDDYYYFYDWIVTEGCRSNRIPVTVTVDSVPPKPTITRIPNTNILVSSSPTNNQWYKNGFIIPGATDTMLAISSNGTYNVIVTGLNDCESVSNPKVVVFDGIEDIEAINFSMYPNPVDDIVNIQFEIFEKNDLVIEIVNTLGQTVMTNDIGEFSGLFTKEIDLVDMNAGLYLLNITIGEKFYSQKLMVR
ncbi:MAG: T9SS type A sorting domain-containing protein [Bacteroidia bacterium]|nr:T9SS type A sorting domain-containing protein [Bacteroidia bacterium]